MRQTEIWAGIWPLSKQSWSLPLQFYRGAVQAAAQYYLCLETGIWSGSVGVFVTSDTITGYSHPGKVHTGYTKNEGKYSLN